jgi:predicted DNA-binding transcriptional regulator AlpA
MRISIFCLRRPGTGEMLQLFPFYLTVSLAVSSACEPEVVQRGQPGADRLISIGDIRTLFKLGRTAAYELTHRPGFPNPVQVSSRCLRRRARATGSGG